MKTSATNRRVHQLMTAISDKRLNPRPDFQRRLVWTNEDKVSFIRTVLRGLPFPEIYICSGSLDPISGEATEWLVDGQQRITTLYQYFKGIPGLRLGEVSTYADLPTEKKEAFLEYEVVVRDLGKHPLDEIREIFELINSANYALNSIEIKNARYAGEFKQFGDEVSKLPEFKKWKIFTAGDVRRMQDVRYCLVLVATLLSTYFNRDEEIEAYLSKYNDSFPEKDELRGQIADCLAFIDSLGLPEDSRALRKTDLFSLLVEVHRAKYKRNIALDPMDVSSRLSKFFGEVDQVAATATSENELAIIYYRSTVRAAIDRGNRYRRGEILQAILDPSYKVNLRFSSHESAWSQDQLELEGVEEGDY